MRLTSLLYRYRNILILFLGLYLLVTAGFDSYRTGKYVYQAITTEGTVTDYRKVQTESFMEILRAGYLPLLHAEFYQPVVLFRMEGGALHARLMQEDLSPEPYVRGDKVSVLTMPNDPSRARLYDGQHLWFGNVLLLGLGAICVFYGYCATRRVRRSTVSAAPASRRSTRTRRRKKSAGDVLQDAAELLSEVSNAAPSKPKRRRSSSRSKK